MKAGYELILLFVITMLLSCVTVEKEDDVWIKRAVDTAVFQLKLTDSEISGSGLMPRSAWTGYDTDFLCWQLGKDSISSGSLYEVESLEEKLGSRRLCGVLDWTSGFFPGSLWYAYAMTGDDSLKTLAIRYTNLLNPVRYYKGTHDLGFIVNCSYGNALCLSPNDTIPAVMIETADNLCSRFDESVGAIRSWDFGTWNYPVIIDNMMNLELLFAVSRITGNRKYKDIAVRHARTTLKNHFRPDYTCWHVVSYNCDGTVECKQTHQGRSNDSSWARGQAWALYGYVVCYRETGDKEFLEFARKIADMIRTKVKTADAVPLWDYDAPKNENTPRDASAAAITASALIELGVAVPDGKHYIDDAERILKSLSGDTYLAKAGSNCGFVLMHSTGALPAGSEIDSPLNYADYYYLEALQRFMKAKGMNDVFNKKVK